MNLSNVPDDALILNRPDDVPADLWLEFKSDVHHKLAFLQQARERARADRIATEQGQQGA